MAEKKVKTTTKKTKTKKKKENTLKAIAHIHSTVNNTIVTITDINGNAITWASSGTIGYKGSKKSTPYAAGVAATQAIKNAMNVGVKSIAIHVNGTGQGKETAIRSLITSGIEVTEISDVTSIPHNGCKPPKRPR